MTGRSSTKKGAKPGKPRKRGQSRSDVAKRPEDGLSAARLRKALAEALEQQAAASEILRVIARSPSDAQPVFDTIARSAARLCEAEFCHVFRFDGKLLHFAAHHGLSAKAFQVGRRLYPMPPGRETAAARCVLSGAVELIPDVQSDLEYGHRTFAKRVNYRSIVAVPMLCDGTAIGAIAVAKPKAGPFPERQLELLKTFADQAVIAIENVRLFNETKEALEQQTATAEILQAISSSPGNLQPVLDILVRAASRFCGAPQVLIMRLDGDVLRGAAGIGSYSEAMVRKFGSPDAHTLPLTRGSVAGRAFLERRTIHVHDLAAESEKEYPEAVRLQRQFGSRTVVVTPLLSEGAVVGTIALVRLEVKPFSERQVQLLRTFADQAVIAIENVRLFTETKEALERETATGEILRVISSSPTDTQPVFEAIARSAAKLCSAKFCHVFQFDGKMVHAVAHHGLTPELFELLRAQYPRAPGRGAVNTRSILSGAVEQVPDVEADPDFELGKFSRAAQQRSVAAVPMLKDGRPIGSIAIARAEPGPFPERQIELLKTFADQAVIAIENVRLFKELDARNRDLTEALEQQTATSDILRVISRSPTDVQPVFDTIVSAALKLCKAHSATVLSLDDKQLRLAALAIATPEGAEAVRNLYPRAVGRDSAAGRAVLARKGVAVTDVLEDPEYSVQSARARATAGFRSVVSMPLLRDGIPIGAINVGRREPGPFPDVQISLLQTFADQAVIAIENVRLFKELESRNRDLTEALEQQTATSEILSVISRSPTDVQPVFDTIAAAELKLCRASSALVFTFDGELIHLAASANLDPTGTEAWRRQFPRPPSRETGAARAILTRSIVAIPDVFDDPDYAIGGTAAHTGFRSLLAVPLLREGKAIGAIGVGRPEPGPFTEKEVALLRTFADQAVIAIENVRLFKELGARNRDLTEALEQQTATSEILGVISKSQTDVQPVFDTIVKAGLALCRAHSATVITFDGKLLHVAARALADATQSEIDAIRAVFPRPPGRDTAAGRAVLTREIVVIPDVLEDAEYTDKEAAINGGFRSAVAVPLMRDGLPIGTINIGLRDAKPFPEKQLALLQTFADQAVIAIENVRLFTELQQRNRDITEALEQQTATSDILRVISRSPTDVQPVFNTIAEASLKLCHATSAAVFTYDGELMHLGALANLNPETSAVLGRMFPRPPGRYFTVSRAVLTSSMVAIPDVLEDPEYDKPTALAGGYRSALAVPLNKDGQVIGGLAVHRAEPGPFPGKQIALLQTFADQAVIAIENVRLFKELDARNRDLTESLEHQTATSEILRVISGSPTDVQPVFDIIGERAGKLCDAEISVVSRVEGGQLYLAAIHGVTEKARQIIRGLHPMPVRSETLTGRAVRARDVAHISDVMADSTYERKDAAVAGGWRSGLAVPMLREGQVIGAIFVGRTNPGLFSDSKIELLKTFADQAVIAIENVRLFTELGIRNRDLTESLEHQTATGEILRVISSSPTDVQPVFEIIAEHAEKLCGADIGIVSRVEGERIHLVAIHGASLEGTEAIKRYFPMPLNAELTTARTIRQRDVVHMADVLADPRYEAKDAAVVGAYRGVLGVPMFREGQIIGAIFVGRAHPGLFAESKVQLLKTFADQAVIAIENVRLFTELGVRNHDLTEALEQQTATSEILRVISQSPRDVQPVFDTIANAALNLCNATTASVFIFDGKLIHLAAIASRDPAGAAELRKAFPRPPSDDTAATRAIRTRHIIAIPDVLNEPAYAIGPMAAATGYRSVVAVPLMRHGEPIGVVGVGRSEPGPFPDKQVDLLKIFADQALIAIENVRLFNELEARTVQLTRSVGELKALGEVGQAVSSTLDLETVLRTIMSHARDLTGADGGSIFEYDATREEFHIRATLGLPDELVGAMRAVPIRKGEGVLGQLAITPEPVEIEDIADERVYQSSVREKLIRNKFRSLLAVPLLREGHLLGGLSINRRRAGRFEPEIVELLKTFAAQSALAIQNARLFREIEDKSRQLETASRHKSEFLANMSHELRTPLNAIIGFSEVLSERMFGEINEKQSEYLSDILESGRHLLSLINDILDLSKIEAGRMELEPSDFNLPGAIENTLVLVRERAQRRGIALDRTIDSRLGTIHADERKVKQVLLNLLSNALKFTPEGGRIEVLAGLRDGVAEIAVKDTGVGIAADDQEAVFEEFRQVGTASKKVEGTGLGLAISRKFIELHGGKIWVKSQIGNGSTFTFTLPYRPGQHAAAG